MKNEKGGIKFRHFYGFNISMLWNQCWNLLTIQDTLVSNMFKVKYYLRGNFWRPRLGNSPCFVWQTIHTSQVLV